MTKNIGGKIVPFPPWRSPPPKVIQSQFWDSHFVQHSSKVKYLWFWWWYDPPYSLEKGLHTVSVSGVFISRVSAWAYCYWAYWYRICLDRCLIAHIKDIAHIYVSGVISSKSWGGGGGAKLDPIFLNKVKIIVKMEKWAIYYHRCKDILKKTDLFLWMLELWRLILVLTRFFLQKRNFSRKAKWGLGAQTWVWRGRLPPLPHINYALSTPFL